MILSQITPKLNITLFCVTLIYNLQLYLITSCKVLIHVRHGHLEFHSWMYSCSFNFVPARQGRTGFKSQDWHNF